MKVQVKLDLKSIQEMFLQNVEKIGLAVVALIVVLMVYSAFSNVKGYDKTPQKLNQLAEEKQRGIDTGGGVKEDEELKITDYPARAMWEPISVKNYATPTTLGPPLFPQMPLRPPPPLMTAQQLRGSADVGAVDMKAVVEETDAEKTPTGHMTGARNETRGQRWIVVTALVPFEKQTTAYDEAFRLCKGYDAQRDFPEYGGYWIERVELSDPTKAANIDWKKAKKVGSRPEIRKALDDWNRAGTEMVETRYFDAKKRLVFPLPPLVNKLWDESVAHPEEIPIISTKMPGMGHGMGEFGPGMGGHGGMGHGEFGRPGENESDPFDPDGKEERNDEAEAKRLAELNKPPAYRLLRYFDFDVEPGKHYVYRVRLLLRNPNCNLDKSLLADPKLAELSWLQTKWSEPSSVLTTPRDTRVLAVSVNPGRSTIPPTGEVMIAKWVQRRGFIAHGKFTVKQGELMNYPKQKFVRNQGNNRIPGMMEGMEGGGLGGLEGEFPEGKPKHGKAAKKKKKKNRPDPEMPFGEGAAPMAGTRDSGDEWEVNYYSEAIAIDFRGGVNLSSRKGIKVIELKSIGEVLLLDVEGNLVVRNELEDQAERDKIIAAETVGPNAGMHGGGMPGRQNPHGALEDFF